MRVSELDKVERQARREKIEKTLRERRWMLPFIDLTALGDSEKGQAGLLLQALQTLEVVVRRFETALSLVEYLRRVRPMINPHDQLQSLESRAQFIEWENWACRMATVEVFNFHEVMGACDRLKGTCVTLRSHVDKALLKESRRAFKEAFPNFDGLRASAAHQGERLWSEKTRKNDKMDGIMFGWATIDGVASTTVGGKGLVGYSINREALASLHRVRGMIYDAYIPVSVLSAELADDRKCGSGSIVEKTI